MFNLGKFQRTLFAAIGTIVLTVTTVGAAIGPARAIETSPIVVAQLEVANQAHG